MDDWYNNFDVVKNTRFPMPFWMETIVGSLMTLAVAKNAVLAIDLSAGNTGFLVGFLAAAITLIMSWWLGYDMSKFYVICGAEFVGYTFGESLTAIFIQRD